MRTIAQQNFRATCLSLMDEVEAKREPIVVTKSGKPVGRFMPMPLADEDPIFGFYKRNLEIVGDVTSPCYTDEEYEEFYARSVAQLE